MTMKYLYLLVVFSVLITSCGNPSPTKSVGETPINPVEQIRLSKGDLFDGEKVRLFLFQNPIESKESNKLFLAALDEFKNKKNLNSASEGFMAAIAAYPNSKSYYELGNVYMETKNYKDALKAYSLAEKLGYEPFSKVMFNIACTYSQLKKYDLSANYLQYAIQSGYSNMENIEKDEDLEGLRTESPWTYRQKLNMALEGMSNIENLQWLQFKRNFMQAMFPLNLNTEQGKLIFDDKNRISYDFERFVAEMRDEKFSREVSKGFYFFQQVTETKDFVALIYVVRDEFSGDQSPLTYRLVTFSNTGKIIDKMEIAGREDFSEMLKLCLFKKDLSFAVTYYTTEFEKDPNEEGYYDNPIVSKEKVKSEKYRISAKGIIESVDEVIASN
jgi:tetratricopeptide (TPR) repeat protein